MEMEPGALIFVTLTGIAGFGMLWFRFREVLGKAPKLPDLWSVKPSQVGDSEIMSRTPDPVASEAVSPRTDAPTDGRTPDPGPVVKPVSLDAARWLRERGVSREDARAFLKMVDRTLGNDTWAAAKPAMPADDDAFVTPYAGRVTKRSYYTDADFPYEEPKV